MWLYTGGRGEPMNLVEGVPPTGKLELMALVYGAQVSGPVEGILLPRAIGSPTGIGEVTCCLASSLHTKDLQMLYVIMFVGFLVCQLERLIFRGSASFVMLPAVCSIAREQEPASGILLICVGMFDLLPEHLRCWLFVDSEVCLFRWDSNLLSPRNLSIVFLDWSWLGLCMFLVHFYELYLCRRTGSPSRFQSSLDGWAYLILRLA